MKYNGWACCFGEVRTEIDVTVCQTYRRRIFILLKRSSERPCNGTNGRVCLAKLYTKKKLSIESNYDGNGISSFDQLYHEDAIVKNTLGKQ